FRGGSQYLAPGLAPRFSDIRVPACFDGLGDIVEENPLDRGREGGEQKCRNDEEGEHAQHVEDRVEPTRLEEGEGGERPSRGRDERYIQQRCQNQAEQQNPQEATIGDLAQGPDQVPVQNSKALLRPGCRPGSDRFQGRGCDRRPIRVYSGHRLTLSVKKGPSMVKGELDVLGVGNAIVDVFAHADDAFLKQHDLPKGVMTLIDADRAVRLYDAMGPGTEMSGGSCGNTIAGLAGLGASCAYIGRVRDDQLGTIF